MRFSRARYVTLCQQSLVTAVVLVVGVSAAGVKTLDIVPAPAPLAGAQEQPPTLGAPNAVPGSNPAANSAPNPAPPPPGSEVDSAPVTPKVREVKVVQRPTTPPVAARTTPQRQQPTQPQRVLVAHKPLVALSTPQKVTGYATVGVTWKHGVQYPENQVGVQVRTEKAGRWSGWIPVQYHNDHGPDGDAGELTAKARPGTDPLVIGDVDQVQMRAENATGRPIPDLQLALIDPGAGKLVKQGPAIDTAKLPAPTSSTGQQGAEAAGQTLTSGDGSSDAAALSAMKIAPKPYIYSRAQWGANEKMREQGPPNYGTVKTGFIHHTVNANNYTAAQVPALLRGIYAYHTQSRGWRDIGYNFLVDRFGRIWEGRYGGVDRAVVGAHTLGYNEVSFAMSAIGNYDIAQPPQAVLDAYARLFAWKLSLYNIRADATHIWVKDRYLNAINGHRDVGQTACPGRYLYAKIPQIRAMTQKLQNAAQTGTPAPPPAPKPTPTPDPNLMTSPTQAPTAAVAQPSITRPRSLNLVGDSAPDLVLKRSDGTIQVLQTGGQTNYLPGVSTAGNWRAFTLLTAVGDVTGDGRGDVLARTKAGWAGIYAGDGSGHVNTHMAAPSLAFRPANLVVPVGDWNRDGHNDVVMRGIKTGRLFLLKGLGSGKFAPSVPLSASSFKSFRTITAVGDLTGDGRPDLIGLNADGYMYLIPSTPGGNLGAPIRRGYFGSWANAFVGGAGDMTGDGRGDLVVRSKRTGAVSIMPGRPWAWFGRGLGPFSNVPGLSRMSAGQMSGSAAPDLVGIDRRGYLTVVPNNGLTNLRGPLASNLKRTDVTQVINAGDWNGDGRGDVITRQTGGDSLLLHPGNGTGTFQRGVVMGYGWKSFTRLAAVGDVTGDGHPDLVGVRSGGVTEIFPGDGHHGFLRPVKAPNYLRSFNLIGKGSWQPQVFSRATYLSSDASFVPFSYIGVGTIPGYDWVLGPGDVDGDGKPDLVARDTSGTLWLLPGTGSGYATRRLIGEGFTGYSLGG